MTPGAGSIRNPTALRFGRDGNLYGDKSWEQPRAAVRRHGRFMDTFVPQGTGGMNAPNSICFGSGVLAMRKDRRNRLSNQAT